MGDSERTGWYAPLSFDPDAPEGAEVPADEVEVVTGGPFRVVGLGAICDLEQTSADRRTVSFSVSEYALLDDGRRVTIRDGLGFTYGWGPGVETTSPAWAADTLESITQDVLNIVLPDPEDGEDHPWAWLAELARERGIDVTADDLRGLPYEVHLTDRVRRLLTTP